MTWTLERVEELKQLWSAGYSASAIGKRLGVSKNAVVGKAHRLHLTARPSPIRKTAQAATPRRRPPSLAPTSAEPIAAAAPATPAAQPVTMPVTMPVRAARPALGIPPLRSRQASKGQGCQWPIGDPSEADFHFCGEPAAAGKPYCTQHCSMAYITKSRDKDTQAA